MPIVIYKKIGETPLEALNIFRTSTHATDLGIVNDTRLSYAGRLDPMAEGLLLVLKDKECDQNSRQQYLSLDKEYIVEVLFGFQTDSYDLLGMPKSDFSKISQNIHTDDVRVMVEGAVGAFIGENHGLKYPPYSSKTIKGQSLFKMARGGETDEIDFELPEIKGSIYDIDRGSVRCISPQDLLGNVDKQISLVKGDFRQVEIMSAWKLLMQELKNEGLADLKLPIIQLKVRCQSGVYMRSLAKSLGDKMGIPALAFSIKRTKIGQYTDLDSGRLC